MRPQPNGHPGLPAPLKKLLDPANPPRIGPQPRPGTLHAAAIHSALQALGPKPDDRTLALVLLWHDHLDEAHALAQARPDADGSVLHAIMHRREPDFWNSKYWWHRAPNHPLCITLPEVALPLLLAAGDSTLSTRLLGPEHQRWNPDAFVDACEAAPPNLTPLLVNLQAAEFLTLARLFANTA